MTGHLYNVKSFLQWILKHVHDLKNEIRENEWLQRESPEVHQPPYLKGDESDAQLRFTFE